MRRFIVATILLVPSVIGATPSPLSAHQISDAPLSRAAAGPRPVTNGQGKGHAESGALKVTLDLQNVTVGEALDEIARQTGMSLLYSRDLVRLSHRVSFRARNAAIDDALRAVLKNTGNAFRISRNNEIIVTVAPAAISPPASQEGTISGRVTDARSGGPLPGVTVQIEGSSALVKRLRTTSAEDGRYSLRDVPAGTQAVTARLIGFSRATRSVSVVAGETATLDLSLEASTNVLDEVVVTGTIVEVPVRELPNPISVITAAEIEQRGITQVMQLLRGQVPSVIAPDAGQLEATPVYIRGGASFTVGENRIKVYIDNVEIADPNLLTNIDPKIIEHIEILRGPQASTLYGAAALGGVMQIFTKKGSMGMTRPQVQLQLSGGSVESNVLPDYYAPRYDHSVSIQGGSDKLSYNTGASYTYTGPWQPYYSTKNVGYFGGLRFREGGLTADVTLRFNNRRWTGGRDPVAAERIASGQYGPFSPSELTPDNTFVLTGQNTIGLRLEYSARDWWQHSLTLGQDRSGSEQVREKPQLLAPSDTLLRLVNTQTTRTSLAYNTTLTHQLSSRFHSALTLGYDRWHYLSGSFNAPSTPNLEGTLGNTNAQLIRTDDDNSGFFGQWRLGVANAVFLTLGLRADDNPNFGDDYGFNFAPRYGLAVVRDVGGVTVKARASYGSAFRPPLPGRKEYVETFSFIQIPNPDLGPESNRGGDGGVDLYFGRRASVQVTYYDQVVEGLIAQSERPRIIPTQFAFTWENLGDVSNKGIELEGRFIAGPLSFSATFSKGTSRVLRLAKGYTGALQPGQPMFGVARSSGGGSVTYQARSTSVRLDVTSVGSVRAFDFLANSIRSRDRLDPQNFPSTAFNLNYPPANKYHLSAGHDLSSRFHVFGRVDNLFNSFDSDLRTDFPTIGRLATFGLRMSR
ncbi:MAG: TonB-dependent receptor [Gemmatimonadaceae bacterium]|nr:TonB-dependent receptor [Gemmatimonadaceae bacterium]